MSESSYLVATEAVGVGESPWREQPLRLSCEGSDGECPSSTMPLLS